MWRSRPVGKACIAQELLQESVSVGLSPMHAEMERWMSCLLGLMAQGPVMHLVIALALVYGYDYATMSI
jgi:hypothetical protein